MIRIKTARNQKPGTSFTAEPERALRILVTSDIANGGKITDIRINSGIVQIHTETTIGRITSETVFSGTHGEMQQLLHIATLFIIATLGANAAQIQLAADLAFRSLPDIHEKTVMAPYLLAHLRGQATLKMMIMIARGKIESHRLIA